ncbi:MAG: dephospho-CoA kinase [Gammaproteobacteria bacterium]|nr:dephospho-CoA kinase [Gammaproteobacteria bacterium]
MSTPRPTLRTWTVYRVGLTGGIASGKSTVASLFAELGVPVIDTDMIARQVVLPGTAGLTAIVDAFGPEVLQPDGSLDRKRLRDLTFATTENRRRLEGILHLRIAAELEILSTRADGPYQVLVVPLLIESGLTARVDRVLVVDCSESIQRARLMVRDGETASGVERLLAAQLTREARLCRADDVLVNSGTLDELRHGVQELHARYLQLATALEREA